MNLITMLAAAQGGQLFANVGKAVKLDARATQSAMEALCPAIAQQLQAKASEDDGLLESLLDVLEDGADGAPLEDAAALTNAEAVADGKLILEDIYGSREDATAALQGLTPDLSKTALAKLSAISATAVVSALTQAQAPMALAGAQQAMGGGDILGTIMDALVKGVVSEATRQLRTRTGVRLGTRRRSTRRKTTARKSTARKTTTKSKSRSATKKTSTRKRASSTSLNDIFRDLLGKALT